jgi:hypothetical protein
MSLATVAEVRALVNTNLDDSQLQAVIDREEEDVTRLYGAPYAALSYDTETLEGGGCNLMLHRPLSTVTSVTEDSAALAATDYRVWGRQGRLERLPAGSTWGVVVTVVYTPVDDNNKRKRTIIELVRLATERTAMKSESIAGEFSYTAPDWEVEHARVLRSIGFVGV